MPRRRTGQCFSKRDHTEALTSRKSHDCDYRYRLRATYPLALSRLCRGRFSVLLQKRTSAHPVQRVAIFDRSSRSRLAVHVRSAPKADLRLGATCERRITGGTTVIRSSMTPIGSAHSSQSGTLGPTYRREAIATSRSASAASPPSAQHG